jgi:hypothetical protein
VIQTFLGMEVAMASASSPAGASTLELVEHLELVLQRLVLLLVVLDLANDAM